MRIAVYARRILLIALVVSCTCFGGSAMASPTVSLTARFSPDELGVNSTILLGFQIATPAGEVPPPLIGLDFRLPSGLGVSSSTLGAVTCAPAALAEDGPGGCSPNSYMGLGSAVAGVPIGPGLVREPIKISILMAPAVEGHTAMSFYVDGASPVIAQLMFPALLLPDTGPFGATLNTTIPPIAGLPGAPDVAIIQMQASIGSKGLKYYKHVHGELVAYEPKGFAVPVHCPTGGFPFGASFMFANGATASVTSTAPCPARSARAGARKRLRA